MDWKRSLSFAAVVLCALSARADRVGDPESDDRAQPALEASSPTGGASLYTSPLDPNDCQLGGRRFGCDFNPKKRRVMMHCGWDFQARPKGNPILRAIGEGTILKAGPLSGACGNGVQIKLKSGLYVYYCHLSKVEKFKEGDSVKAGQSLGRLGQSGGAKGPHLHFVMASCAEIGERCAVDPAKYLNPADMCKQSLPDHTRGPRC